MRINALCFVFLWFVCGIGHAQSLSDSPSTRRQLAEKYLQVMPMREMLEKMSMQITQNMPADKASVARESMMKGLDIAALEAASIEAMVKTFTAAEINAMVNFYGSTEGRAVTEKMPAYMKQLGPLISGQLMRPSPSAAAKQVN